MRANATIIDHQTVGSHDAHGEPAYAAGAGAGANHRAIAEPRDRQLVVDGRQVTVRMRLLVLGVASVYAPGDRACVRLDGADAGTWYRVIAVSDMPHPVLGYQRVDVS